jgi:hypothetical protein
MSAQIRTVISIIGSAGRKEDAKLMSAKRFNNMVDVIEKMIITGKYDWSRVELRSGGAAWCDHVAVVLFLRHQEAKLTIFSPCQWIPSVMETLQGRVATRPNFEDTGASHWAANPGRLSNHQHHQFSQKMGYDTLQQIENARLAGAIIDTSAKGFHKRNLEVAKCDMMIAMTSSDGDAPRSTGGTFHTWSSSKAWKAHLPLHNFAF